MRLADLLPTSPQARYAYDHFAMVPPRGEALLDYTELASFEAEFVERYTLYQDSLAVVREHHGMTVEMRFTLTEDGLFTADPGETPHCLLPLPLGTSLETVHGRAQVLEADESGVLVAETYSGVVTGTCTTRYQRAAWIVWQEIDSDRMQYRFRKLTPPG